MKSLLLKSDPQQRVLYMLVLFFAAVLLIFGFGSNAFAKGVSTKPDKSSELQTGSYSLISRGCNASEDPATIAFLQKEGVPYNLRFPGTAYAQIAAGLQPADALNRAEAAVKCNPWVQSTELKEVHAPDGTLIGYEVRPVFGPVKFGSTLPVDTHYMIKGNDVVASIKVDPLIQANDMGGSS